MKDNSTKNSQINYYTNFVKAQQQFYIQKLDKNLKIIKQFYFMKSKMGLNKLYLNNKLYGLSSIYYILVCMHLEEGKNL